MRLRRGSIRREEETRARGLVSAAAAAAAARGHSRGGCWKRSDGEAGGTTRERRGHTTTPLHRSTGIISGEAFAVVGRSGCGDAMSVDRLMAILNV